MINIEIGGCFIDNLTIFRCFSEQDEYMVCPYNKAHSILRSRMPAHLIKCVKQFRGEPLSKCPYNAMHLFPKGEEGNHMKNCVDACINYVGPPLMI